MNSDCDETNTDLDDISAGTDDATVASDAEESIVTAITDGRHHNQLDLAHLGRALDRSMRNARFQVYEGNNLLLSVRDRGMDNLSSIGEYAMHEDISEKTISDKNVIVPIGEDDCSVVKIENTFLIQSCDSVSSKPLTSKYGKRAPKGVANYLLQANLSDVLSTGAIPQGIHTIFGFPSDYSYEKYKQFIQGFSELTNEYDISWLGGDLKETEVTRLAALIQGIASDRDQIRTRGGAEAGDVIIVTRNIGTINAATYFIDEYGEISEEDESYLYERTKMPRAPFDESLLLTKNGLGNGGLDITDGLGMDLKKMADKSNVGLRIKERSIPIDGRVERIIRKYTNYHPSAFAFTLAGDWQIVVTMSEKEWESIQGEINNIGKATKIGEVTDQSGDLEYITEEGNQTPLPTGGKEIFTESTTFSSKTEELLNEYQEVTERS